MENINHKILCYKSGRSFNEVYVAYTQALIEARSFGIENDEQKVMSILETILEIDNDKSYSKVTNRFLESGKSFDIFMEELTSASIPQSDRPEPDISEPLESKKESEDDDNDIDSSYNDKLKASCDNLKVVNDDDVEHL